MDKKWKGVRRGGKEADLKSTVGGHEIERR